MRLRAWNVTSGRPVLTAQERASQAPTQPTWEPSVLPAAEPQPEQERKSETYKGLPAQWLPAELPKVRGGCVAVRWGYFRPGMSERGQGDGHPGLRRR